MVNEDNHSPVPDEVVHGEYDAQPEMPKLLSFPEAMEEVIKGKYIRRVEWKDASIFCALAEGFLRIKIDGMLQKWLVNDGDMTATDWIVV